MFIYKFPDASVGFVSFFEMLSWFCRQNWAPQYLERGIRLLLCIHWGTL